jgi:hypothetical protein
MKFKKAIQRGVHGEKKGRACADGLTPDIVLEEIKITESPHHYGGDLRRSCFVPTVTIDINFLCRRPSSRPVLFDTLTFSCSEEVWNAP